MLAECPHAAAYKRSSFRKRLQWPMTRRPQASVRASASACKRPSCKNVGGMSACKQHDAANGSSSCWAYWRTLGARWFEVPRWARQSGWTCTRFVHVQTLERLGRLKIFQDTLKVRRSEVSWWASQSEQACAKNSWCLNSVKGKTNSNTPRPGRRNNLTVAVALKVLVHEISPVVRAVDTTYGRVYSCELGCQAATRPQALQLKGNTTRCRWWWTKHLKPIGKIPGQFVV